MIAKYTAALLATLSAPVFAGPVYRLVDELDQVAYQKAQQRDDTATRTLSNINIKVRPTPTPVLACSCLLT